MISNFVWLVPGFSSFEYFTLWRFAGGLSEALCLQMKEAVPQYSLNSKIFSIISPNYYVQKNIKWYFRYFVHANPVFWPKYWEIDDFDRFVFNVCFFIKQFWLVSTKLNTCWLVWPSDLWSPVTLPTLASPGLPLIRLRVNTHNTYKVLQTVPPSLPQCHG